MILSPEDTAVPYQDSLSPLRAEKFYSSWYTLQFCHVTYHKRDGCVTVNLGEKWSRVQRMSGFEIAIDSFRNLEGD